VDRPTEVTLWARDNNTGDLTPALVFAVYEDSIRYGTTNLNDASTTYGSGFWALDASGNLYPRALEAGTTNLWGGAYRLGFRSDVEWSIDTNGAIYPKP
jgi:hypothetical protein